MSESTATAMPQEAATARAPYPPGWPHLLVRAMERLPGPTWIAYLTLVLIIGLVMHLRAWSRGDAPVGTPALESAYWGLLAGALLWAFGYLERAAGAAFDAFRPALAPSVDDPERLRYELTMVPRTPALAAALVATVLTVASFVTDPASSDVDGVPGPVFFAVMVVQAFMVSLLFVFLYQLIRQVRQVRRILDRHAVVDVFRPGPLQAFPRLMAMSGVALVFLVASSLLVTDPSASTNFLVSWAPYVVLPPTVAIVAFIVPLYGTHQRLADERERLADEAEERLKGLLREINRDIDARDLGGLDPLERALGSVIRQREIVAKLPTWPWSPGTLRGFASAILLPLALFLTQRLLSQLV
jgi:hypothetical protein